VNIKKLLWTSIFSITTTIATASPYGINVSYLILDKDPQYLYGYRFSLQYYPSSWVWKNVHIFIDGGYGHWWVDHADNYGSLNIYSIAPVLRLYFANQFLSPFFDISIGPSYMTNTRISNRNLGMHFAFQDQMGLGISFGQQKNLSISVTSLHYSNGSLCAMNAGITIPLMLNVSYRF